MGTITITNPVRQHRLEGWIRATELAIAYNNAGINWARKEIAWSKENEGNLSYAVWYGQWAQECLSDYEAELRKAEEHLKELQTRLSEEIEKPL